MAQTLDGVAYTSIVYTGQALDRIKSAFSFVQGKFVYVVGADNKAEAKPVQAGDFYGDRWIITSGLTGGETVRQGSGGKAPELLKNIFWSQRNGWTKFSNGAVKFGQQKASFS